MKEMDFKKDYHKGISGIYLNRIIDKVIKHGNLYREKGLILDFGCGHHHIKKRLPGKKIVGYDTEPSLSDVKDYRILKPEVIVCSGVFEYMTPVEANIVIRDFYQMNPRVKLVIAFSRTNRISKIAKAITGNSEAHQFHKMDGFEFYHHFKRVLNLQWVAGVFFMNDIYIGRFHGI